MSYRAISIIIPQNPNFIDGTVEGTKTNYPDDKVDHDHTYYGNGCPNGWGTDGSTGSDVACSSRIVEGKNDPQYIGVYYTFQAATSGSGGSLTTDNTNPSDTFCPLGWQLPYGGTGGDYYDQSKSLRFLLGTYNYGDNTVGSNGIESYPINISRAGYYHWNNGKLYSMAGLIRLNTGTNYTNIRRYILESWTGYVNLGSGSETKNIGLPARYVYHFSIPPIDGTVEGTPSDLTIYKDDQTGYTLRDHSYYGNGCPNNSSTPCSTRIVQTADNEDQKNGTYYHFQAATSGAGGAIETDNVNAPDTFCPLGWQLAYSGTGGDYYNKSKSWIYLFEEYGITNDRTGSDKLHSYPFSYVYSGGFHWGSGLLFNQARYGHYWSLTVYHSINSYYMLTSDLGVTHSSNANKANGFPIRCVYFFTRFHRRHGGRKSNRP